MNIMFTAQPGSHSITSSKDLPEHSVVSACAALGVSESTPATRVPASPRRSLRTEAP
jgi:hypothetical protein